MDELLTRKEVMKLLKISRSTLYRLEKRGELKRIQISPRKILYKRKDIEELLRKKAR